MTVRYVASTGSNTAPYDTWASAATAPLTVTALMGAGDITYIKNETFTITASTTYLIAGTTANPGIIISTSDTTNAPPTTVATGALIDGSATAGVEITVNGKVKLYGIEFKNGGAATLAKLYIGAATGSQIDAESCAFTIANTNASTSIKIGSAAAGGVSSVRTKSCTFTTGNAAGQTIQPYSFWESVNDTFAITTTSPTTYFSNANSGMPGTIRIYGGDLSAITTTLVQGTSAYSTYTFVQCLLNASVARFGASATALGNGDLFFYDCASGDTHYQFEHYNYLGNTTISTAIYMSGTGGASYNAADAKHSWKITGVNGTYATPYVSPWISVYNEAVAAVTPRLEILRDGSTTAYNDDQVWGEFSAKVTANVTTATIVTDRRGLVAAAAVQAASALGAADWAGETTPWYGKLEPTATITPTEIGDIGARVCVAGAITVYVNPRILGI